MEDLNPNLALRGSLNRVIVIWSRRLLWVALLILVLAISAIGFWRRTIDIEAAVEDGNLTQVKAYFMFHSIGIDSDRGSGRTLLYLAAKSGHADIVDFLLDKGADPDVRTEISAESPLSIATEQRHDDVIRLLLEEGADVNIANSFGETPCT